MGEWEGRVEGVGEGNDDHNILYKILKLIILKKTIASLVTDPVGN